MPLLDKNCKKIIFLFKKQDVHFIKKKESIKIQKK